MRYISYSTCAGLWACSIAPNSFRS